MHSPLQNQNYDSSEVLLSFTIIKPDAWFTLPYNWGTDYEGNPLYVMFGNITSLHYVVENGERQNIPIHDISFVTDAFPNRTLTFSTNLTFAKGAHSVKVGLEADSYYSIYDVYTAENASDTAPIGMEN